MTTNLRCNEQIRITPIRIIGPNNEQIGVMPTSEALRMAYDQNLDLVEVAPNVRPPVCRIMDYGKWKYQQKKGQKKHHEQELKEVRLRPKTDTHDLAIKVKHAIDFLHDGDKVQFTMVFRGRERAHREVGMQTYRDILAELGDRAKIERPPSMDGRNMVMIVSPGKMDKEPAKGDGHPTAKVDGQPQPHGPAATAAPTGAPREPRRPVTTEGAPQERFGTSLGIPTPVSASPAANAAPTAPTAPLPAPTGAQGSSPTVGESAENPAAQRR